MTTSSASAVGDPAARAVDHVHARQRKPQPLEPALALPLHGAAGRLRPAGDEQHLPARSSASAASLRNRAGLDFLKRLPEVRGRPSARQTASDLRPRQRADSVAAAPAAVCGRSRRRRPRRRAARRRRRPSRSPADRARETAGAAVRTNGSCRSARTPSRSNAMRMGRVAGAWADGTASADEHRRTARRCPASAG